MKYTRRTSPTPHGQVCVGAPGVACLGRRRRGEIYAIISRLIALRERYSGYCILVVDRSRVTGVKRLSLEVVRGLEGEYIVLEDGSMIPLHRVVGVEDRDGRLIWTRRVRGRSI